MLARLLKLSTVLFFMPLLSSAQHPWETDVKNAASDMATTMSLVTTDQVCISAFQTRNAPDTFGYAVAQLFAQQLERYHAEEYITFPCNNPDSKAVVVSGFINQNESGMQTAIEAGLMSTDREWNSLFYLQQAPLPDFNDSLIPIDAVFQMPDLPAKATIQRMSGYRIDCTLLADNGTELEFEIEKRNGKKKLIKLHKSEVFSVLFKGGEWLLYAQDLVLGDDYTVEEMRVFLAGAHDAINHYNAKPTALAGVAFGSAGPIVGAGGLILTIAPVIAYALFQMAPIIQIKGVSNPDYIDNEIYALGYESVARSKKIVGGLKGSAVGAAIGVIVYFIFK